MSIENQYLFAKMSTVISISLEGMERSEISFNTVSKLQESIRLKVEPKVRDIINSLKSTHSKFQDPDFGPSESDPTGAISMYGHDGMPAPAGTSKYPDPAVLRWDRPHYADTQFDGGEDDENSEEEDEFSSGGGKNEKEVWCTDGELFVEGSSSGDVIQGKLGDCWFLGALSVLGTNEDLLKSCFWHQDAFKEFGLYVCAFYKDGCLRFVIIDDLLPVFDSSGKLVFAQCKDSNELWVPLIEKAYAKIHGCYKALIGGYVHFGLADLTGFLPRMVGLKEGYLGFADDYNDDIMWSLLKRYRRWGCLMGTSIQSKPGEVHKVESNAPNGLKMGHAYSFLGVGEIKEKKGGQTVKLVKLRNPWGFGEWTGAWSDTSQEREDHEKEINEAFRGDTKAKESNENNEIMGNDGAFFMKYEDWRAHFTSLFVAINFPPTWMGKLVKGEWNGESGGPREMSTWMSNPKIRVNLPKIDTRGKRPVFVGLYIHDTRLTLGKEYYTDPLYKTAVSFDIVKASDVYKSFQERKVQDKAIIPGGAMFVDDMADASNTNSGVVVQPPYLFGSTQVEVMLDTDVDYFIIPSLKKRTQPGTYFVHIYTDGRVTVEGGTGSNVKVNAVSHAEGQPSDALANVSMVQRAERLESFRERFLKESSRLGVGLDVLQRTFAGKNNTDNSTTFKRKLMDLNYNLADFPDDDFNLISSANGVISSEKFIEFFKEGLSLAVQPVAPPAPVDDLVFTPIDIAGELTVIVGNARNIRKASTWFSPRQDDEGEENKEDESRVGPQKRPQVVYDPVAAKKAREYPLTGFAKISAPALPPKAPDKSQSLDISKLKLDTSFSAKNLPGPSTFGTFADDAMSVKSILPSETNKGKIAYEKIGLEAGQGLHSDTTLQKLEVDRVGYLALLRQRMKSANETKDSENVNAGLLIVQKEQSRTNARDPVLDEEIKVYLGMDPLPSTHKHDLSKLPSLLAIVTTPSRQIARSKSVFVETEKNEKKDKLPDIWDFIIDRVILMAASRNKIAIKASKFLTHTKKKRVKESNLKSLSTPKSNIPTPSVKNIALAYTAKAKGLVSTPSLKKTHGTASVTAAAVSQVKQKAAILDARDALNNLSGEEIEYTEVYRRLVQVPLMEMKEVDPTLGAECLGDSTFLYGSALKNSFEFFDKNHDGIISYDEFVQSLKSLTVDLSDEDYAILFRRFDVNHDGSIECKEFINFFNENIESEIGNNSTTNTVLHYLKLICANRNDRVTARLEIDVPQMKDVVIGQNVKNSLSEITSLDLSHVKRNSECIARQGIPISEDIMARISRVFKFNLSLFLEFIDSITDSVANGNINDVDDVMGYVVCELLESMLMTIGKENKVKGDVKSQPEKKLLMETKSEKFDEMRSDVSESKNQKSSSGKDVNPDISSIDKLSDEAFAKVFCTMASNIDQVVEYDEVNRHFNRMVNENIYGKAKSELTAQKPIDKYNKFNLDVLCRLLIDEVLYSPWNKSQDKSSSSDQSKTLPKSTVSTSDIRSTLSFSGLMAFIKSAQIESIINRLRSIVYLESCIELGAVNFLVHCYLPVPSSRNGALATPPNQNNHILIIASDPLSSNIFKMKVDIGNVRLPFDFELCEMIVERYKNIKRINVKAEIMETCKEKLSYYNPLDTPMEDKAITDLLSKLRVVNNGHKNILLLSEDSKFVQTLQGLIEKANLPFFTIVNEIAIIFEVSKDSVQKARSMQKLVFGSIRKNKNLCTFISNVLSDMHVILRTYDDDSTETMPWKEMVAYLCGNRNPFVTIQLLPEFVEPKCGMISYIPKVLSSRYAAMVKQLTDRKELQRDDEEDKDATDIQTSSVDLDGGRNPIWNAIFKYQYQPPSLTNCPVITTDIVKMRVEDIEKYLVIFVREAKDKSVFMTAYDSRTATEYMLFGGPTEWTMPGIFSSVPIATASNTIKYTIQDIQKQLEVTVKDHESNDTTAEKKLHLSFAITPRVLISVYNQKNKSEQELLGFCQLSISSVLSGTGNNCKLVSPLMYEKLSPTSGNATLGSEGALTLELGYSLNRKSRDAKGKTAGSNGGDSEDDNDIETELKPRNSLLNLNSRKRSSIFAINAPMEEETSMLKTALHMKSLEVKELLTLTNELKKSLRSQSSTGSLQKVVGGTSEVISSSNIANNIEEFLDHVLSTFMSNYIKRNRSIDRNCMDASQVLRPLSKVLKAYEDKVMTVADVEETFGDLFFDTTAEILQKLFSAIKSKSGAVSGTAVYAHFNDLICRKYPELQVKQSQQTHLTSSNAVLKNEAVLTSKITKMPEGNRSEVLPSRDVPIVSNAKGEIREDAKIGKEENLSNSGRKKSNTTTLNETKMSEEPSESVSNAKDNDIVLSAAAPIDWSEVPLPDEKMWERRVDGKGKTYYVNHELKITQWNHPLAPRQQKVRKASKRVQDESAIRSSVDDLKLGTADTTQSQFQDERFSKTAPKASRPQSSKASFDNTARR